MTRRKGKTNGNDRQAQASNQHPSPIANAREDAVKAIRDSFLAQYRAGYYTGPSVAAIAKAIDDAQDACPVVEETMPILAHRAARLMERTGGPQLVSMTLDKRLPVDDDATCTRRSSTYGFTWHTSPTSMTPEKTHPAPDVGCTCGFYAVPLADELPYETWHVDLLVELSGKVIEHETGYRAGHQRIVEVRIPACGLCASPVDKVRLPTDETPGSGRCVRHAAWTAGPWLNRKDLERVLPVTVTYLGEN